MHVDQDFMGMAETVAHARNVTSMQPSLDPAQLEVDQIMYNAVAMLGTMVVVHLALHAKFVIRM